LLGDGLGKIPLVLFLSSGLFALVIGCVLFGGGPDVMNYVNQDILGIAELERVALNRYASVTGKNYTSDQAVYIALKNNIIPPYKRFLELLREIKPQRQELEQLHVLYIRGAELTYRGFKAKMLGIETKDRLLIRLGNAKIDKGRKEIGKWRQGLIDLYKKYGLSPK
jgi:hypothetical protein